MQQARETSMVRVSTELLGLLKRVLPETRGLTNTGVVDVALRRLLALLETTRRREMTVPVRVQRKRTKGFNLQKASPNGLPVVYVGRPTRWGNPFALADYSREESIRRYAKWLRKKLQEDPAFLDPLKGKNLACFCPLDKACHADVILAMRRMKSEA
jgi:hypothetical protein